MKPEPPLDVRCPSCGAPVGEPCTGGPAWQSTRAGTFGRPLDPCNKRQKRSRAKAERKMPKGWE